MASPATALAAISPPARPRAMEADVQEQRKVALIRTHLSAVWAFLRRLGLSPADADDAGQEVFLVAVRKIDAIVEGQEKRFLFGIAVRVASRKRRSLRASGARAADLDVEACIDAAPTSEEVVEHRQALALLDVALATLDEDLRTVFVLYEIEEMTAPEIATLLDVPTGTVASRLRRAREQFEKTTRRMQAGQR